MLYPNQFHIELTQKCNLNCLHCFANASSCQTKEMVYEDVVLVYEKMKELGMIYANLSGGEPTLNKDFFKIIDYVVKQPFETCLLTNGLLWDEIMIEKICSIDKNRDLMIQISLDGPYEVMAKERLLTLNQYEKILDTIKRFKEKECKVGCLIVINSLTADTAIETIQYALEELQVDAVQAIPLFPTGRANENEKVLQGFWEKWEKFVIDITKIKKYKMWGKSTDKVNIGFFTLYEMTYPLDKAGMHDDIKVVWGLDLENLETFISQTKRNVFCEAGQTEMTISSDKKIYPCVASLRTIFGGTDLESGNIMDIWLNDESFNFFRNVKEKVISKEPCKSCEYKTICGGGCRIAAKELIDDVYAPDPRCPIVQKCYK